VLNAEGVVLYCNPASTGLIGLRPEQMVGHSLGLLVYEEDVSAVDRAFARLGPEAPSASLVLRFRLVGGIRRIRWSLSWDAETERCYGVAWDVTDRDLAHTRFVSATEASPTALIMVDPEGSIVLANRAASELLGYGRDELMGRGVECLLPDELREHHTGLREIFSAQGAGRPMGAGREFGVRRRDGSLIPVEIGLEPVEVDGQVHTVAAVADLRERNRAAEELRALAHKLEEANRALEALALTDSLTGLWNRRKFLAESIRTIQLLRQSGGPFSVILADIDRFKGFNDEHGHAAGDEILRRVAHVVASIRSGSDFCARYGGEEFIVGVPGSDAAEATALAERLRSEVARLSWRSAPITMSLGVSTATALGERGADPTPLLERLIDDADRAMYRCKAGGRNRVAHADELSASEKEEKRERAGRPGAPPR
jgi:diguanylate cyclase (GGDEF)-like protein/PAS domain S-box-containing protein